MGVSLVVVDGVGAVGGYARVVAEVSVGAVEHAEVGLGVVLAFCLSWMGGKQRCD